MIKKNWKLLLITSLVTLLPVVAGLILWNQLPEQLPSHWNAAGEVDGWSSKPFAVFGLPLILVAFQWVCVAATSADPKKENHSERVLQLIFWIFPVLSVVMNTAAYATGLGKEVRMELLAPAIVGVLFVAIGNYLPKCQRSYTIGIKLPWTLNSDENWNKTHRLAGKIWVAGGLLMMLAVFVGGLWLTLGCALAMAIVPCVYSYILYRKGI